MTPSLIMLALRPKLQSCLIVCILSNLGILLAGLYVNWHQALIVLVAEASLIIFTNRSTGKFATWFAKIYLVAMPIASILYFDTLFVHRLATAVVMLLVLPALNRGRDYLV